MDDPLNIAPPMSSATKAKQSILRWIRDHGITPGRQLPPQSALVRALSCSETTIQKAMRQLAEEGVVRREVGRGTFLVELPGGAEGSTAGSIRDAVVALSATIGLCAFDHKARRSETSYAFSMLNAAEQHVRAAAPNVRTQMRICRSLDEADELLDGAPLSGLLVDWRMDPLSRESWPVRGKLDTVSMPVVECTHAFDPRLTARDMVCIDNVRMGRLAVMHLHELGHRRILLLADREEVPWQELRVIGATHQAELYADEGTKLVTSRPKPVRASRRNDPWGQLGESGFDAWRRMPTRSRPTAVFAVNDHAAMTFVRIARNSGVDVPEDVSVIGVDNDVAIRLNHGVDLSSIDPMRPRVGEAAADLLLRRIAASQEGERGERGEDATVVKVAPTLFSRGTTAAAKG